MRAFPWSNHLSHLSEGQILRFLVQLTLLLFVSRTMGELLKRLGQAPVIGELLAGTEIEPFSGEAARRSGEIAARCDTSDLSVVAVVEVAERRNCAVVAQRQAVLRTAASLLGHELVLYAV